MSSHLPETCRLLVLVQGITIERPEERRAKGISSIMKESDTLDFPLKAVTYVLVPADTSRPLQELTFSPKHLGDALKNHLQSTFSSHRSSDATQSILENSSFSSKPGHVEVFPLAHGVANNDYTGVNLYFDQTGRLKGFPLNTRSLEYAQHAGYNPPPEFYGDIFLGRVKYSQGGEEVTENLPFRLGADTIVYEAEWFQQAAKNNAEHQLEFGGIPPGCRADDKSQTGGIGRDEEPGYHWKQTEEEMEVSVQLPDIRSAPKDFKVEVKPRQLFITYREMPLLDLPLFEAVDVDGSTWQLDKSGGTQQLIITMEKVEQALWSRIRE